MLIYLFQYRFHYAATEVFKDNHFHKNTANVPGGWQKYLTSLGKVLAKSHSIVTALLNDGSNLHPTCNWYFHWLSAPKPDSVTTCSTNTVKTYSTNTTAQPRPVAIAPGPDPRGRPVWVTETPLFSCTIYGNARLISIPEVSAFCKRCGRTTLIKALWITWHASQSPAGGTGTYGRMLLSVHPANDESLFPAWVVGECHKPLAQVLV